MWKWIHFPVLSFDIYICVSKFNAVNWQFQHFSKKDNIKTWVFKCRTLRVTSLLVLPPQMRPKIWEKEEAIVLYILCHFDLFYSKVNDLQQKSLIKPQMNVLLDITIDTAGKGSQRHLVVRITITSRMNWLIGHLLFKDSNNWV